MIYFTADNHFGHSNIIRLCERPFENVDEMDETMIKNWNSRVRQADTVFILGDMFFKCQDAEDILKRLKGRKRLILGNHDSWVNKVDMEKYFLSVDQFLEISDGKHALTLCHYPLLTWKHQTKTYMVHGHIHANTDADFWPLIKIRERVLNAGVDVNNFIPVSFEEMLANNKRFKESR